MPRRRSLRIAGVAAVLVATGCGGGDGDEAGTATTATTVRVAATTSTTLPIEGERLFVVDAGHREGTIAYPETPPVGGVHNPVWMPCGFYDQPVPSERAVHSLEHGAIWITYRPDLPQAQVDALAALARSRGLILVSRWDEGLPSPVVLTGWGRQLPLDTATDPRLMDFVRRYANQGPEINAPC